MKLKIDKNKSYAIALEGGGARGGYEIGVWQALDEAGITFEAVSGTSVGALNGAMYAMGDLAKAVSVWEHMELTNVIEAPEGNVDNLRKMVSGKFDLKDVKELAPGMRGILKNKGLDVTPLRNWVREVVEPAKIRETGIRLFATTVDLSEKKGLVVEINTLPDEEMCDMLLASAYHPTFKLEKLGGKLYADGGFIDSLPITPLTDAGYREIIAVHIPGMGVDLHDRLPKDTVIHHIRPDEDLGGVLNFDSTQAQHDMLLGYLDCQRMLYGLLGKHYYIDKTISNRKALDLLLQYFSKKDANVKRLRDICEIKIPAAALSLGQLAGDYYDILLALSEEKATAAGLDRYRVYTDAEFAKLSLGL